MSDSKTFEKVTQATFNCVKRISAAEHGTVYDPPDANKGQATTETMVGKVVLLFDFDLPNECIQYSIVNKPTLAPASSIWGGISDTIKKCQSSS